MTINAAKLEEYKKKAVSTTAQKTFTDSLVGILGAPGVGKTSLLLSASKHFKEFPNKGPLIFLSDLCIIQIDPGATDGYKSAGYDCHLVDYRAILKTVDDPEEAMEICIELARSIEGVDYYGLDSVSQYDDDELNYLARNPTLYQSQGGNTDTRGKWDLLRNAHGKVYNLYLGLPGIKFFIGHTKSNNDDIIAKTAKKSEDREMAERKMATSLAGGAGITLDTTGKSERIWIRLNSLLIGVRVIENPQTKAFTRVLETEYKSSVDLAVKNRFSPIIGPSPEFHLRKIINTIRGVT